MKNPFEFMIKQTELFVDKEKNLYFLLSKTILLQNNNYLCIKTI